MATRDDKMDVVKLKWILHVPTCQNHHHCHLHCLWLDHGTCVDPDGLLHVESDVPQELSEEKQNDQIHPRLTRTCAMKTLNNIYIYAGRNSNRPRRQ